MNNLEAKIEYCVKVIIEPDEDEFHVFCPDLKGLHTSGKTIDEAIHNAQDAVTAYIISLKKHNEPIPSQLIKTHEQSHQQLTYQYCFHAEETSRLATI
jgi:predicted RNase H-like HicB family nuclease